MSVTAVVVAADPSFLEHILAALAEQERPPERILLVDARPADAGVETLARGTGLGDRLEVVPARGAKNFGDAVRTALEAAQPDTEWLWLLHDDSPPDPGALAELLRATGTSRAVGIAGCKQVDFAFPDRLVSVGVRYTRAGRRLGEVETGEIDQGQYDHREDVFAVGTAGMFIRASTWTELGGTDPALGPFLDGAELSRRVRLAGERVIVVPSAKVRHARSALWHGPGREHPSVDGANSFLARRVATLHLRLVTVNLWALLLASVAMVVAAPVRALWRIATDDLALAVDELRAPLIALARPGAVYRSRRTISRSTRASRAVLRPLYATRREVWGLWWHRWRAARVERRRRAAPSELEIAERRTIGLRRRFGFAAAMVILLGLGGYLIANAFAGAAFTFPVLTGGGLAGVDDGYRGLWERALSAWAPAGDGTAQPAHPFAVVLATLATLAGAPLGVSTHAFINILLGFALPLAGLTAWFAAGAFTRSVLLRGWAALTWAVVPVFAVGVVQGRLPAVIAHILLPLLALALARSFGVDHRDVIRSGMEDAGVEQAGRRIPVVSRRSGTGTTGAAAAAGLLLAAILASAPILLPGAGLALLVMAVTVRASRRRLLLVALPPLLLFIPHAIYAGGHGWAQLLFSPAAVPIGLTDFAPEGPWWLTQLPWPTLAGFADTPAHVIVAAIVTGILVALAFAGLFRGGDAGKAARWGWCVAGIGVVTAVASGHLLRHPQYDWLGNFQRLPEWAGPGASVAAAGMLIAAVAAVTGSRETLGPRGFGVRHVAVGLGLLGMIGVVTAGAAGAALTLWEEPQWQAREAEPIPALARQATSSGDRSRVLMMAPGDQQVMASVWRSNGPQMLDPQRPLGPADPATSELSHLVAELFTGTARDVGARLSEHAVALVLVPLDESAYATVDPMARAELVAALDGIPDLERVTENDSGTLWRNTEVAARVQIRAGEERIPVPSETIRVAAPLPEVPAEPSTLVLAERADPRWRATLEGQQLRAIDVGWQQAFELPASATGELTIEYAPTLHRAWAIAFVVVFGLSAVLALPVRRRPEVVA